MGSSMKQRAAVVTRDQDSYLIEVNEYRRARQTSARVPMNASSDLLLNKRD